MRALLDRIGVTLIDDFHNLMRFWSVQMTLIGAILYPLLISVQVMPPEIQALFPLKYRALAAVLYQAASFMVRAVKQPALAKPAADPNG